MPISASFAGAEEVDYGADGWEGVALGRGQADVERGFKLIAELDQVERVASEVVDKGGVGVIAETRNPGANSRTL